MNIYTKVVLLLLFCANIKGFDVKTAFEFPSVGDNGHLQGFVNVTNCNSDLGISKSSTHPIEDSSMSASSEDPSFPPYNGRLGSKKAWMPAVHNESQYLMIDLKEMMIVLKSAVQGSGSSGLAGARVLSYLLYYSIDGDVWSVILEREQPKLFMGNINSTSEVSENYFSPVLARYIKFVPYSWNKNIAMRVELYGCDTGLGNPLGMSSNKIKDDQIKATSVRQSLYQPSHGRLKLNTGGGAWCASPEKQDTKQYLQVTLKDPFIITSVATQGMKDGNSWVRTYYVSYTVNLRHWLYYHDVFGKKLLKGNVDEESIVTHYFPSFFMAVEVRIHPQAWENYICLRTELYGFSMWDAPFCHSMCHGAGKALCLKSPSKKYVQTCICNSGHEAMGGVCQDIDECSIGYDLCGPKEECVNLPSSYKCKCGPGYTQIGKDCRDVDECAKKTAKCPYRTSCRNIDGSYRCDCNEPGFMGNGTHCIDINECETGAYECKEHSSCVNAGGSYMCFCDEGFTGNGKVNCTDVNECMTTPNICGPHGSCKNTVGSYQCICKEGYAALGSECEDIDECASKTPVCDENALCINIPGSVACQCKLGFQNADNNCLDVNECQENMAKCHSQAECHNTPGSYICICKENFFGDGFECSSDAGANVECAEGDEECKATKTVSSRKKRSSTPEKSSAHLLEASKFPLASVVVIVLL